MSVVIVEDHQDVRMVIRTLLEDAGISVVGEAATGEEGLALVARTRPALVVLDRNLGSGMDGVQAAQEMHRVSPESRILIFSAFPWADHMARSAQVDGFLSKSEVEQLAPTVRDLLGGDPQPEPQPETQASRFL